MTAPACFAKRVVFIASVFSGGCGPAHGDDAGTSATAIDGTTAQASSTSHGSSTSATDCVEEWPADLRVEPAEDLQQYSCVRHINGSLFILEHPMIEDLAFLSSLESVGGTVQIGDNPSLVSLSGLDQLASVGGMLTITGCETLVDISALAGVRDFAGLELHMNPVLRDLTSLAGAVTMHGSGTVSLSRLPAVETLAGFSTVESLAIADDDASFGVSVVDLESLVSIQGIDGLLPSDERIALHLSTLPLLSTIDASSGPTLGGVNLEFLPSLSSLAGLELLEEVGQLTLYANMPALHNLEGLEGLRSVGTLSLGSCDPNGGSLNMVESLSALEGVETVDGLFLGGLPELQALDGLPSSNYGRVVVMGNPQLLQAEVEAFFAAASVRELVACGNGGGDGCDMLPYECLNPD